MTECMECARLAGRMPVLPRSGDARDTACDVHKEILRWVKLFKPPGELGHDFAVLPETFVERVP